ncbi:MAG TPA: FAD-dependent monooxygenase [Burkholderiaceae bacterium]|nr:FAD-dependent monooxygenase [Burkholderiaceae bacterium]
MSFNELPASCDVLVVGAGPAGAACASWLARAGVDVVLVDQYDFPRDKVCGDGLIPDAHHALVRLGVHDEVMAAAQRAGHVACIGPRGGRIDVPGLLAVLPRRILDDIVCRAAVRAGARLFTPWRFEGPLLQAPAVHGEETSAGESAGAREEQVVGARLRQGELRREIRASWVVLAPGAVPQALIAAGVCERRTPSGVALRGYVKSDAMVGRITELEVVWHRCLRPGYGWIFPAPGGRFNIGVGVAHSHAHRDDGRHAMQDINLRQVFDAFCTHYAPARELMATGVLEGDLKGAPLRCTLAGARHSRPGLLVAGEAAGSTYSFTGEGIGKAYETGLLAAEALLAQRQVAEGAMQAVPAGDDDSVRRRYGVSLATLQPRFALYERANHVNAHPWLADLLIWRARGSDRILRRMAGVLEETSNPGNLMTVRGIARLILPGLL